MRNVKSRKENPIPALVSNKSASLELNRGASSSLSTKGPAAHSLDGRASSGVATDPQSLYARVSPL